MSRATSRTKLLCMLTVCAPILWAVELGFAGAQSPLKGVLTADASPDIWIVGEISPGLATDVTAALIRQRVKYPREVVSIHLNSPGGDVYTAMDIGRVIRRIDNHAVILDAKSICYSACVLIFAGGAQRIWNPGSEVGLHRPFTLDPSTDYEVAHRQHKAIEKDIKAYLEEMNVPAALYDTMAAVPAAEMRILSTRTELDNVGLVNWDPTFEDSIAAINMRKYGITRSEFNERLPIAIKYCDSSGDAGCWGRVMTTGQP